MMSRLALASLLALLSSAVMAAPQLHKRPFVPAPSADAQPDPSLTDDDIRGQVSAFLGSIDTSISLAQWKALGIRAETPLLEVLNGGSLPTRRAKAIDGLSAIGTSRVELFKTIANNEQEPFVVRYAAIRGIGYLLPENEMIAQLSPMMKNAKDSRVRSVAALVMVKHAPATCSSIRTQVKTANEEMRLRFGPAMDACFGK